MCLSSFPCRLAYCTVLYCALIHMLGWLFVPEPCGGKVATSTGRHRLGISRELWIQTSSKEVKLGVLWRLNAGVSIYVCDIKGYKNTWLCCRGKNMQPALVVLMQRCVNRALLGDSCGSGKEVRGSCWVSVKWLFVVDTGN